MRRKRLVPECLSLSAMDCGPACLTSVARGHGIDINYEALRTQCAVGLDGSSIDNLEIAGQELGLGAEQVMIPHEFVRLCPDYFIPCVSVIQHQKGVNHFVVLWRRRGDRMYLMDPDCGRRVMSWRIFSQKLHVLELEVEASDWVAWTLEPEWSAVMQRWLAELRVERMQARAILERAMKSEGWWTKATLDATLRFCEHLVQNAGLRRGKEVENLARHLFETVASNPSCALELIAREHWSAFWCAFESTEIPFAVEDTSDPKALNQAIVSTENLWMVGTVHLRFHPHSAAQSTPADAAHFSAEVRRSEKVQILVPMLGRLRRKDLAYLLAAVAMSWIPDTVVSTFSIFGRAAGDLSEKLPIAVDRLIAVVALVLLASAALLVQRFVFVATSRMLVKAFGIELERWMNRINRIHDYYFETRLLTDIADRLDRVEFFSVYPIVLRTAVGLLARVFFIVAALHWIDPGTGWSAALAVAGGLTWLLATTRMLQNREETVRSLDAGLQRFFLDLLVGATALRYQSGRSAMHAEFRERLDQWLQTSFRYDQLSVMTEAAVTLWSAICVISILALYLAHRPHASVALLVVYWVMQIDATNSMAHGLVAWWRTVRVAGKRHEELLRAPVRTIPPDLPLPADETRARRPGVKLSIRDASIGAGGRSIVEGLDLTVWPGEHVAIVGRSGAGKSTFVGAILGSHLVEQGEFEIDGRQIDDDVLWNLRQDLAWVDPAAQIWRGSLADNITFGTQSSAQIPLAHALDLAELLEVVQHLPDGAQTDCSDDGARFSGGEGQRIRFARALRRPDARLVILDEAFRGLERSMRRLLMPRAREHWRDATLLCVSHDVTDTRDFDRVLVFDDGKLAEDGAPQDLLATPDSIYARLFARDEAVQHTVWGDHSFKRMRVENTTLHTSGSLP